MPFFILLLTLATTHTTFALETSYVRLQEPKGWACQQEQTAWVCRSTNSAETKESFLVIKAKLAGRADNMETFYESLKNPLPLINATGNNALSRVYSAEKISIANKDWVKAVHLNSVSQNYFTEYLVTLVGDLAIGIELNYHQSRYQKYKLTLDEIIKTIRFVDNAASKNNRSPLDQELQTKSSLTSQPDTDLPNWLNEADKLPPDKKLITYIAVGLVVIIGFLIIRLKK